ncbi:MAG: hypothetical protein AAF845_05675, partial [Bacteroidota bacterium]
GDLSAAVISRVRDGVQVTDAFALLDDLARFGRLLAANAGEAGREIADLEFDEGVELAVALASQAPKIRGALLNKPA